MTTPEFPTEQPTHRVSEAGTPIETYRSVLTEKYADFSGRARRAEFWWSA